MPNFVVAVVKPLPNNNVSDILKNGDIARSYLNDLFDKLHPPVLVVHMKSLFKCRPKKLLSNGKVFKKDVASLALGVSLTEVSRQQVNRVAMVSKRGKGLQQQGR